MAGRKDIGIKTSLLSRIWEGETIAGLVLTAFYDSYNKYNSPLYYTGTSVWL